MPARTILKSRQRSRRGFSLLEVMLATGILLGSIVVLGELSRIGSRNVQAACAEAEAERLAQSVLSQVVAARAMPELVTDEPIETSPGWLRTIEVEPLDRPALSAVRITVSQDLPEEKQPVSFVLVRWMSFAGEATDAKSPLSSSEAGSHSSSGSSSNPAPSDGSFPPASPLRAPAAGGRP